MIEEVKVVSDPILMHIWSSLHNYAYEEALFAAERLFAETKTEESLYMLASCFYRMNRPKQAARLLCSRSYTSAKSRVLLARCFFDINMYQEAERTIFSPNHSVKSLNEITSAYGDQACYVYLLLGDIYRYQQRFSDAVKCYKECLSVNPLMWTAYESLCKIGEFVDVDEAFNVSGNLGLITPTFTVVRQSVTATKSPLGTNMKSEREKLASRENVNPNDPLKDPAALNTVHNADEDADTDKHTAAINNTQILKTTYISHCSVQPADFSVNQSTLPDNAIEQFTPSGLCIPLQTPAAPLGNAGDALQKRAINNELSFGGGDLCTPPTFGLLASIPHSPMFACVPVFSRQDTGPGFHESSQPFRLALHPASSNIQQESRPNAVPTSQPPGIGHLQSTILFDTTASSVNPTSATTISQLRSRGCKVSTPVVNTPHLLLNRNSTLSAVPLPPRWITGSPISSLQPDLVTGNTSTPSASGVALSAAFVLPKALDLEDFGKIRPSPSPLTGLDPKTTGCAPLPETIPMDLSESLDSSASSDVTIPENANGLFTEPRTRAQKARAAAAASVGATTTGALPQRRSPRLNRTTHKAAVAASEGTAPVAAEDSVVAAAKCTTQTLSRIAAASPAAVQISRVSFAKTAGEGEGGKSQQQRTTVETCPKLACSLAVAGAVDRADPRSDSLVAYILLLRRLGLAFSLLSQHEYKSAMAALAELSHDQLATGLVLSWAARAHSEAADYPKSRRLFNELRRLEPWQLRGMDLFSTVLWYLQDEIELSHLANDLLNLDRNAPEPWLAAGNCFSLQREHEVAVRFFRRALQVCPTDSYACTLLGHEYMSMDNLERAVSAFRHALRLDERNYKARFGLSNVYFKQEFFDLADAHLVRALTIFPQSCLLLTHLGAVRARVGRLNDSPGSSLDCLNKAVSIDPNNTLARYHRACALTSLGRYQEAISEFERLVLLCPREAMIYFRLGQAYQKIGNIPQAMIYFSCSMELDPKGVNTDLHDFMASVPPSSQASMPSIDSSTDGRVATQETIQVRRRRARPVRYSRRGLPHRLFPTPSFRASGASDVSSMVSEIRRDLAGGSSVNEDGGGGVAQTPGGGDTSSVFEADEEEEEDEVESERIYRQRDAGSPDDTMDLGS